ncbi:MAG: zinc transporter ZntB [Rhodospirillales bacterium]|nr:zinc transporter ZntB [Rhodospirillales bacterium]
MTEADGLICAYRLDGKGGGEETDWAGVRAWKPGDGLLWVHLDRSTEAARDWFGGDSGLDPLIADALLADDTRPRSAVFDNGLLVNLRGVNLNPGAVPEDMVSARVWIEPGRIVTTRRLKVLAIQDLRDELAQRKGVRTGPGFLIRLARSLTDRLQPVEDAIGETLDELEDALVAGDLDVLGERLTPLRRQTIALRRHLAPQRDALTRLHADGDDFFDDHQRARLREVVDRIYRIVEELDAMRERAAIIQDERRTRISERMDRAIYMLSIVATVMLPLTFVTGLLGMNVGGIPGEKLAWAFWAVCGGLAVVAVILLVFFRRIRWL